MSESRKELARTIEAASGKLAKLPVVTGFDGFVDEMITVVDEREGDGGHRRVETIADFGALIKAAAGRSSLREIIITETAPGGCAINMGDGLASLGLPVTTFATVGEPSPHPAFAAFGEKATLHSWGAEPGRTLAYEFADGKLMHSAVQQLSSFTPDEVSRRLQDGFFEVACSQAALIALTDWTLFPHMTACWQLLQREVFQKVAQGTPFFLDLVDPSGRSEADLRAMMEALPGFEASGPTTLGLNVNEANRLSGTAGLSLPEGDGPEPFVAQAAALREHLGLSGVVIHSHRFAVAASRTDQGTALARHCAEPVKSTGAGDRFNAGYAVGILLDLPVLSRLELANTVAGLYVRTGQSPGLPEVVRSLKA